jgi:hypothetical protein
MATRATESLHPYNSPLFHLTFYSQTRNIESRLTYVSPRGNLPLYLHNSENKRILYRNGSMAGL